MNLQEDIRKAATRDPVNITVYGNPVLDMIVRVGPYSSNAAHEKAITKIGRILPDGSIECQADSYIVGYLQGEPLVFGPLNPEGQTDTYLPGQKYPLPFEIGTGRGNQRGVVTKLLAPDLRLGGGGANVLNGFFDVFAQLKLQFIATVERNETGGRLDPYIEALTDVVGVYDPVKLYEYPGVNLCVEGLGMSNDRTIFTAQLPQESDTDEPPVPHGKSIMVNTIYSPRIALDALAYASYQDRFAVLALTKSLCSKKPIQPATLTWIKKRHQHLLPEDVSITSVYDFVKSFVLPKGHCVCIVNEDELEHFTGLDFFITRGKVRVPCLGRLIGAVQKLRDFQAGQRHRVYVTCGHWGSFVLDEHDHLIYCGIYEDRSRVSKGKTAIGDTYATFILAIETIGNYIRPYVIPAEDVIRAAAAGADTSVYVGFGFLNVADVNGYIGQRNRMVADLGPITTIPLKELDLGLDQMRESDYERLARPSRREAPGTLQEVIGRAFLKT